MWRWSFDLPKSKPEGRRHFFSTYSYSAEAYPLALAMTPLAISDNDEKEEAFATFYDLKRWHKSQPSTRQERAAHLTVGE